MSLNCLDDTRTLSTLLELRELGIKTFVLGLPGTEMVTDLLDDMALAGGTDEGEGHYAVGGEADLLEVLRQTSGSLVPCDYEFQTPPSNPDGVTILLDGNEVPRDPEHLNGWDMIGDRYMSLYGEYCMWLRDGEDHSLGAHFECNE